MSRGGQKGKWKPACRSCVIPPMAASHCFGGHLAASTSQKNTAPPFIQSERFCPVNPGRTVCLHSCGLPVVSLTRPTGAQVFALFPPGCEPSSFQHLVTAPDRPPRAQAVTGNACPLLLVGSYAVHVSTDTKKLELDWSIGLVKLQLLLSGRKFNGDYALRFSIHENIVAFYLIRQLR